MKGLNFKIAIFYFTVIFIVIYIIHPPLAELIIEALSKLFGIFVKSQ